MDIKNPDIIIKVHDELIKKYGGKTGVLNVNSLLSSLARPFSGRADGKSYFPTLVDKASALIHSLIENHPFVDGNKRTAAQVTKSFILENGYNLEYSNDEIVQFVLDIANHKMNLKQIKDWIVKRISKLD